MAEALSGAAGEADRRPATTATLCIPVRIEGGRSQVTTRGVLRELRDDGATLLVRGPEGLQLSEELIIRGRARDGQQIEFRLRPERVQYGGRHLELDCGFVHPARVIALRDSFAP